MRHVAGSAILVAALLAGAVLAADPPPSQAPRAQGSAATPTRGEQCGAEPRMACGGGQHAEKHGSHRGARATE